MTLLTNTFEGGTDTTTLTAGVGGNTGGASGDFFDLINVGADGVVKFSAAQARGNLSCQVATRTNTTTCSVRWHTQYADLSEDYGRVYFYMDDRPTSTGRIVEFLSSAPVLQAGFTMSTTGVLQVTDAIAVQTTNGVLALLADTWYRLEWKMTVGVELVVRVYEGDSTTLLDEIVRAQTGATAIGEWRAGQLIGVANIPTATGFYYFDNIMSGAASWITPPPIRFDSSQFPKTILRPPVPVRY